MANLPKSVATITENGPQDETLPPPAPEVPQQAPPASSSATTCKLGIWSVAYMGGTLDRCKERCSGDFNFVQNNPKDFKDVGRVPSDGSAADVKASIAAAPGLQGRTWFSTLLLFDEIYDFLMELGDLDTPTVAAKKQSSAGAEVSGQTPNAGWANRLLQTGLSVHETKTCGCFGGLHAPTVSTALAGNFHPNVAVEMLRGIRGDHGCQTKARLFFTTGKPIQPHEHYASRGITSVREWCPVPDILKDLLRLEFLSDPVTAATKLEQEDCLTMGEALFTDDGFFPDPCGWSYKLPDGVGTFLRFRKTDDLCQAEWCIANRDVEVFHLLCAMDAAICDVFPGASITDAHESIPCKTSAPLQENVTSSFHPTAQASHTHYSSTAQTGQLVAGNVFACGFKVNSFDVGDRQCI